MLRKNLLALVLLLTCATPLCAADYSGRVSWIYDGDTLLVDGVGKIRLLGIDTPEALASQRDRFYRKQFAIGPQRLRSISRQAKKFNIEMLTGVQVQLVTQAQERDKHDRLLAYLYLPDGRLFNRTLLEKGLATVFRRYQFSFKDDFLAAEALARASEIGLWQQ